MTDDKVYAKNSVIWDDSSISNSFVPIIKNNFADTFYNTSTSDVTYTKEYMDKYIKNKMQIISSKYKTFAVKSFMDVLKIEISKTYTEYGVFEKCTISASYFTKKNVVEVNYGSDMRIYIFGYVIYLDREVICNSTELEISDYIKEELKRAIESTDAILFDEIPELDIIKYCFDNLNDFILENRL